MARGVIDADGYQTNLAPPSLREWLPEGDLGWFVVDATSRIRLVHSWPVGGRPGRVVRVAYRG